MYMDGLTVFSVAELGTVREVQAAGTLPLSLDEGQRRLHVVY
jgi:hypothetical protein